MSRHGVEDPDPLAAHHALEQALATVPFLAPMGVTVEEAGPGRVVLRLPADKRTRDFDGYVASGALFTIGELAATVVLATHPLSRGRRPLRREAHITYSGQTNRPVRARAVLETVPPEVETITVAAELLDRHDGVICTVEATFALA